jgi:hypothetical protein
MLPTPGPFQFKYNQIDSDIITDVFIGMDVAHMRRIETLTNEDRMEFASAIDGMKYTFQQYSQAMDELTKENQLLKEQIATLQKELSIENRLTKIEHSLNLNKGVK